MRSRGCSGLSYTLEYADERGKFDEVVEDKGVTILVDPKAVMFILGTEMDYVEEKLQKRVYLPQSQREGTLRLRRVVSRLTASLAGRAQRVGVKLFQIEEPDGGRPIRAHRAPRSALMRAARKPRWPSRSAAMLSFSAIAKALSAP